MIELLNNSPEWVQVTFWVCSMLGAMVIWRFRKYVVLIGLGAVAVYNVITGKED